MADAEKILKWRTSQRVTKFMNHDMDHDIEAQKRWLEACYNKESYYHWIIQYGGKDVGLLNFSGLNLDYRTTSWGYYIGEESVLGIGGLVAPYFYNFAFDELCVEKILAEVFYNNTSIISGHLRQGYAFDPSRDHVIIKNGKTILVISMYLNKEKFQNSKMSRLKQKFPTLNWNASPFEK